MIFLYYNSITTPSIKRLIPPPIRRGAICKIKILCHFSRRLFSLRSQRLCVYLLFFSRRLRGFSQIFFSAFSATLRLIYFQYNFPELLSPFHFFNCLLSLFKWKNRIDNRFNFVITNKLNHVFKIFIIAHC